MNILLELKQEYEVAKLDYAKVTSKIARVGIYKELMQLKKQIDDEERRKNSSLKTIDVNETVYELPYYFNRSDNIEVHNGYLYKFEGTKQYKDGSYYCYSYVWIPQAENKYACLLVRILGGDIHGDRYFLSVSYYKHPSDSCSYLEKSIHCKNRNYKEHYEYIISKMGYKHKEDNWKANLLEKLD